jgi:ADP-ribosylglycohydrolase
MLGAIAGDVIGSVREGEPPCPEDFELFHPHCRATDDSVLTVAVAETVLDGGDFAEALRRWGRCYPRAGYSSRFYEWIHDEREGPYQSFGNGAAMRVSPIGWAYDTLEQVSIEARRSAAVSHDHPEGLKGAESVAAAIFVARTGGSRADVREVFEARFGYDCSTPLETLRGRHRFDVTCQGTVPVAATVALASESVEDAIRKAVSMGGDADTLGCIAGAIAEALHGGVPRALADAVRAAPAGGHARGDGTLREALRRARGVSQRTLTLDRGRGRLWKRGAWNSRSPANGCASLVGHVALVAPRDSSCRRLPRVATCSASRARSRRARARSRSSRWSRSRTARRRPLPATRPCSSWNRTPCSQSWPRPASRTCRVPPAIRQRWSPTRTAASA